MYMSDHPVPTIAESQRIIANAMVSLSAADRDVVMEDLNAIHHPDRSGAQNRQALSEHLPIMEEWLSSHKSDAYLDAERMSRDYVANKDLLCSFLHSSCFSNRVRHQDAIQAAQRMNEYLENKRWLFGSQWLVQDRFTLEDLDADDIQCLETGYWQKIGTDVAGRVIVGTFPTLLRYRTPNSFLRAMLYFYLSLLSLLDERQDQSLVLVYYNTSPSEPDMDRELVSAAHRLLQSLPIKVCAHHVALHPNIQLSTAVSLPILASTSNPQDPLQLQRRARYVFHSAKSRDEVELKLRRYGITIDLPCNRDGTEIRLDAHRQWMNERRTTEQQQAQRAEMASYFDHAATTAIVASGLSNPSSRSSSTYDTESSSEAPSQVNCDIQRRSFLLDDSSASMMKPSAKDLLDRQLASDANTPVSVEPLSCAFQDLKPSAVAKLDSTSTQLSSATMTLSKTSSSTSSAATKKQRMNPAMLTDASIILPRDSDILFGRGSGIQNHPGRNVRRRLDQPIMQLRRLTSYFTSHDTTALDRERSISGNVGTTSRVLHNLGRHCQTQLGDKTGQSHEEGFRDTLSKASAGWNFVDTSH
jgi:hypothetical protein